MKGQRLDSLDAFRGITIAGMILVNNPGSWGQLYSPLGHAKWDGWTPTDLVFPFFLFIVGVSIALAFARRREAGVTPGALFGHVVLRAATLFLLGLVLAGFFKWRAIAPFVLAITGLSVWPSGKAPHDDASGRWRLPVALALIIGAIVVFAAGFHTFQESHIRVPGVLQRIAICYLVASAIALTMGTTGRVAWIVILLAGYALICAKVHPPAGFDAKVVSQDGLLHEWIDQHVYGEHLYSERPDPEGLLSTIPSIATTLLGVLVGQWFYSPRDRRDQALGLFVAGNVLLVLGCVVAYFIPISKKIWTPSYVLLTAGLAIAMLATCFWLIDIKDRRKWAWPFIVFGTNAILVYCLASVAARLLTRFKIGGPDGVTIKAWLMTHVFDATFSAPKAASLAFALSFVAVWLLLLIPLYRRRIFIKV